MTLSRTLKVSVVAILATFLPLSAQVQQATVTETEQSFRTYPYSDPDPVGHPGAIYPYFRFQGYTASPVTRTWNVITLENQYIRVLVAPQMGGKILGAYEKGSGLPFLYFNNVIKFREIAMRGPWTSGGVEFNFGDLGHAPTTASPVDYLTRSNPDGSVSCVVGTMDLASRTEWRVEIRLPADRAYVETRSFWYNPTDLSTSRYHWMNGAADAGEDLEFIYPGSAFIGHDGEVGAWPFDPQGRDITKYRNNNFGSYKSYHVLGKNTDFFGARWGSKDLGVLHWSHYTDKPGKKIWIWGLSREGEIWRNLLTDPDLGNGQYVEIQSGLHFNQPTTKSYLTPFKHMAFLPSTAEQFTECWMPFRGLQNVVAANQEGALDVRRADGRLQIGFCPFGPVNDSLMVRADGKVIGAYALHLRPLQAVTYDIALSGAVRAYEVNVGTRIAYASDGELAYPLERPLQPPAFDWTSAYGLSVDARERMRARDYDGAYACFERSLKADPTHLPSLSGAAELALRRFDTAAALGYARRALAIDAYDAEANYAYGLVQRLRGRYADAEDGCGFAARSAALRPAASVQLAEMAFIRGIMKEAEEYARQALTADATCVRALRVLAVLYRITGDTMAADRARASIGSLDPLNHFVRWESYRASPDARHLRAFKDGLRGEFPHESCQEIAATYIGLGAHGEAIAVLRESPSHPLVQLWTAYLLAQTGRPDDARVMLDAALKESAAFVFPFRSESEPVLAWAATVTPHWKIRYYRALLYWSRGRRDLAQQEFAACGARPDLPAFYLTRASFAGKGVADAGADLRRAVELGGGDWRTHLALTEFYGTNGRIAEARKVAGVGAALFPASYALQLASARAMIMTGEHAGARAILDTLAILPFEGARYGREAYRFVYVMSALDALKRGNPGEAHMLLAKAREWPERLGAGKPYDTDDRVEDLIDAVACDRSGDVRGAQEYRRKIIAYSQEHAGMDRVQHVIGIVTMRKEGKEEAARALLRSWPPPAPQNAVQAWARFFLDGKGKEARALEATAPPEMDRWSGDAEYRLVRSTLDALGIP
ncbi:MAG: DUF5107 domain-containing protein [Ignavibacteriae bacterium]|nr:DUF5107 domain-containing protein [Ignavibacteriota bacterium]